ncbi:MAG: xylose isomerase-like enzyme, partial [Pseudonocardiales bacterium]|nr:xylose isomerase-like enzyme [Pseudonocardiales bacterium]
AVEFDDIPSSLALLADAGVPVFKLQEAAALWVPAVSESVVAELERFTDTIYLSQTTELRDGRLTHYLTLRDAVDAWTKEPGGAREWRTHFHVPVFLDDLGPFRTTRFALEAALRVHAATPQSTHLEIETYTWDVLPADLKSGDIVDYVVRELEFVRNELEGAVPDESITAAG